VHRSSRLEFETPCPRAEEGGGAVSRFGLLQTGDDDGSGPTDGAAASRSNINREHTLQGWRCDSPRAGYLAAPPSACLPTGHLPTYLPTCLPDWARAGVSGGPPRPRVSLTHQLMGEYLDHGHARKALEYVYEVRTKLSTAKPDAFPLSRFVNIPRTTHTCSCFSTHLPALSLLPCQVSPPFPAPPS
jgi:hypothetical protein